MVERLGMVPESVRAPVQFRKTSKYGLYATATATRSPYTLGPSDETSDHEAAHVTVARKIRSATRIQSGYALGSTDPEELTAPAAAAAAADGHGGHEWDLFLTEKVLRVPFNHAIAGAKGILARRRLEKKAIAAAIHRKGTIGQRDVEEAFDLADKVRRGIATVVVTLIDHKGKKLQIKRETNQTTEQVISEVVEGEGKRMEPIKQEETPKRRESAVSGGLQNARGQENVVWSEKDQLLFDAEVEKSKISAEKDELVGV